MPVTILVAVLAVGWAVTGVLSIFRIRAFREERDFLYGAQAEAQELRTEAERRAQAAETELDFLRQTVVGLTQRPAIVTLPEQHIQTFANIVQSIVHPESQVN